MSLSLKVERELRNETMMIKAESTAPNFSRASYFAASQSDAGSEEGELLDENTTSEANSPDSVRDDIELQLATQLYTKKQHEQQDHEHRLHHQRADVDPRCASLADILPII
jgi:hypothetical protein